MGLDAEVYWRSQDEKIFRDIKSVWFVSWLLILFALNSDW